MVVVKKALGAGPEIITARDLLAPAGGGGLSPAPAQGEVSLLDTGKRTINTLDSYITLADKGITMLGRIDSIASKFMQRSGGQQQQQARQIPVVRETEAPITYVHGSPTEPVQPAAAAAAPVQAAITPAPAPAPQAGIDVGQIVQALDIVEKMQPGITVKELREAIAKQPDAIANIIRAYSGVK